MSVNDPIADMLTRVRNSLMIGQALVAMPSSKIKAEIARILKEEGYIESFEVVEGEAALRQTLRIKLKYVGERRQRKSVITGLERISRPGRRVFRCASTVNMAAISAISISWGSGSSRSRRRPESMRCQARGLEFG